MLKFNQTSSPYDGIIQRIEQAVYGMDGLGRISGNATLLGQWTTSVNLALTNLLTIIFEADGRWQFDDSNHTDYPFIKTNLVSGQRDYTFTTDENNNLILDIQRVAILQSAIDTKYNEIFPVDQQTSGEGYDILGENTNTGTPFQYDKTANGIFLDPIPNYNATNGLKVYISREGSFFTTSDTSKKPGVDARLHEYLVYKPVLEYGRFNVVENYSLVERSVENMEQKALSIYGNREQDEDQGILTKRITHR